MNRIYTNNKTAQKLLVLVILFTSTMMYAQDDCPDPTASAVMEINNVRAGINAGQMLFYDGSDATYEVPIGEGVQSMFAANIWIGAMSESGQLHLSGATYNQDGSSFLSGPLDSDGNLPTEICNEYDRIFQISRTDVETHIQYFESVENGTVDIDFPNGYIVPTDILEYPGNGNVSLNISSILAPFVDVSEDGLYDPLSGDHPAFTGMVVGASCENCEALNGDLAFFWIDNDLGTASGSQMNPLGIEIHNVAYAFQTEDDLSTSIFFSKKIINKSANTYNDLFIGLYADADLGFSEDDYVACDVQRNLGITYNADDFDESSGGQTGYGEDPPSTGFVLLNTIEDDEDMTGMSSFMLYDRLRAFPQTDPQNDEQYYSYLNGLWQNGETAYVRREWNRRGNRMQFYSPS